MAMKNESRFRDSISRFGEAVKQKLSNRSASGEPEDQLRTPLEILLGELAELCDVSPNNLALVGESSISDLKTRPDYAVTVRRALCGFIEVKAPGKGADPRRFRNSHDKAQWEKLKAIPNLLYTDGNEFGLWRDGELVGGIVRCEGDVGSSGRNLSMPTSLLGIVEDFLRWQPIPPRSAKDLAVISARLCRLMRDEVTEQLALGSPALTDLAEDWRRLLFPDATDAIFADGYAQAVTFGLLMARARGIDLAPGLVGVGRELAQTDSLIGTALRLLTDNEDNQKVLQTSLGTLTRVLNEVSWETLSRGDSDAWLYFYEDFLTVYDKKLRKQTGSYYTPPEVVEGMVRLVDECLRTRFNRSRGLAARDVIIADPAVGTGTFLLGLLRRISTTISDTEGPGAAPAALRESVKQLIAFEIQLGPFAVAQLRVAAELKELTGSNEAFPLRMFVTDTLADPNAEQEYMPAMLRPISESRRRASAIKRDEPITVVLGNPPYKEKARGRGGWIESGSGGTRVPPLNAWVPPAEWGLGAHAKHLKNLYIYFWRWATWKVFDQEVGDRRGVIAFITVAGFLSGPGFQRMRDYLRRTADDIWIVDCSPEGHQPPVASRIFQGVQQPICIMLVSRTGATGRERAARVRHASLPVGPRLEKFVSLGRLALDGPEWVDCPEEWRAPFLPAAQGGWSTYPALEDLFSYDGSGVMPGRTWVIAPDRESLEARWRALQDAPPERKAALFHPHLRGGQPGDRHVDKSRVAPLAEQPDRPMAVSEDRGGVVAPVRYAFRSFDRQWIVPDARLINQPNPRLWRGHGDSQVYLTAVNRTVPTGGPAITFTNLVPDLHHYDGRGGRVLPLWLDREGTTSNVSAALLRTLTRTLDHQVTPENVLCYLAATVSHPGFVSTFANDLRQPGIRVPITIDPKLFEEAVNIGQEVIWLHCYGERFADPARGRAANSPRLQADEAPHVPKDGAIPTSSEGMPEELDYDAASERLLVGSGVIENVPPEVWEYEVSGKHVIRHWFSYRKRDRGRPIMGDRRPPSPLGGIQPDHWLPEYTTDLLELLHVLGRLVKLEPVQADLLRRICEGPTLSLGDLAAAEAEGALTTAPDGRRRRTADQPRLL